MRRAIALAVAGLMSLTAPVAAQEPLDPVAACVRDNLTKYAPPDRAVVDQYLSIESACRERIENQGDADIDVSPLGGGGTTGSGGSVGSPATGAGPGDGGTGSGDPSSPRAPGSVQGDAGSPAPRTAPSTRSAASARPEVLAALERAQASGGPPAPSGLLDAPAWLIALVIAGLAAVVGAAWVGVRSHPR